MADDYRVLKDDEVLFRGKRDECFGFIMRHQGQSVEYATTYGGYKIVQGQGEK